MYGFLQRLGRSLMLPVAVLPAAALILGIGYFINSMAWGKGNPVAAFMIASGDAIIGNIGILFAVGVALGMSKSRDGAVALAAVVGFYVVIKVLDPASAASLLSVDAKDVNIGFSKINNSFIGIIIGLISAATFNRFHQTELPAALAFFSGRRLVPILVSVFSMILSVILLFVWPIVFTGLINFGEWMVRLGPVGAGLFGFFNRLLIPTGLHHALNLVFWFDVAGINDIGKFLSHEGAVKGQTGMYQAGFYPVMMFGMPGAALAMYHSAKSSRKKAVAGIFLAGAIAAIITGVTEPVEFLFMFTAPILYIVHAVLTGLSMFIAASFHWTAGFGFSAGLFDFILSVFNPVSNKPYMLLVLGLIYFILYYVIFRAIIKWMDIKTPGRESDEEIAAMVNSEGDEVAIADDVTAGSIRPEGKYNRLAGDVIQGVGGRENIESVTNCATRLRFELKDNSIVNESLIKQAGAAGVMKTGRKNAQVIIGTHVQQVADAVDELLK